MKADEIYKAWKESKREVAVNAGLRDRVMSEVRRYEESRRTPLFNIGGLVEKICAYRPVKVGLIGAAASGGLVRMGMALWAFLAV